MRVMSWLHLTSVIKVEKKRVGRSIFFYYLTYYNDICDQNLSKNYWDFVFNKSHYIVTLILLHCRWFSELGRLVPWSGTCAAGMSRALSTTAAQRASEEIDPGVLPQVHTLLTYITNGVHTIHYTARLCVPARKAKIGRVWVWRAFICVNLDAQQTVYGWFIARWPVGDKPQINLPNIMEKHRGLNSKATIY